VIAASDIVLADVPAITHPRHKPTQARTHRSLSAAIGGEVRHSVVYRGLQFWEKWSFKSCIVLICIYGSIPCLN